MKLTLSKELLDSLPEPASDGVVRVTAGLRISPAGEVLLVELNDMPVDGSAEADANEEPEESDAGKSGMDGAPDLGAMAKELYGPQ